MRKQDSDDFNDISVINKKTSILILDSDCIKLSRFQNCLSNYAQKYLEHNSFRCKCI